MVPKMRLSPLVKPIFVIGCPRSGTTLIGSCLGSHPEIGGSQESLFLGYLGRIYEDFFLGNARHRTATLKSYVSKEILLNSLGACADDIYSSLLTKIHKIRYVDHTPWYASWIEFINLLYPDAVFVHEIGRAHV